MKKVSKEKYFYLKTLKTKQKEEEEEEAGNFLFISLKTHWKHFSIYYLFRHFSKYTYKHTYIYIYIYINVLNFFGSRIFLILPTSREVGSILLILRVMTNGRHCVNTYTFYLHSCELVP